MLKAILWKEFREVLPWLCIAGGTQLAVVALAVAIWRSSPSHVRFADLMGGFLFFFYAIAVVLPIAIGGLQNYRERQQNTLQFLLHRPISREWLYGGRMLLGSFAILIVGCGPLVGGTLWVESLPHTVSKDNVSIVHSALHMTSGVLLLYLGAFFSTLRLGRWYGSGFLPLLAGLFIFIALQVFASRTESLSPVALVAGPAIAALFVVTILRFASTNELV